MPESTDFHGPSLVHDYQLTSSPSLADVKPQNVLVNWTSNEDGTKTTITDVVLADFWVAWRLETQNPRQPLVPLGHMAWRSLKAQTGRAMTKASDMYSFGLVVSLIHLPQFPRSSAGHH